MRYRKKPVTIDAYQTDVELDIPTLEGTMHASVGDYIITGVRGELYPCKPDIFLETYEPADGDADDATGAGTCRKVYLVETSDDLIESWYPIGVYLHREAAEDCAESLRGEHVGIRHFARVVELKVVDG